MGNSTRFAISMVSFVSLALGGVLAPEKASAEPYIGDIIPVGYNFCPRGWVEANGQLLAISQYSAMFSLMGTTFGGNGTTNFAVPNLQGRAAIGQGAGPGLTNYAQGSSQGTDTKTITIAQMPAHNHTVNANNLDGDKPGPGGKLLAAAPPGGAGSETIYSDQPANRQMSAAMIDYTGVGSPITTKDPYLTMIYCIATQGIFPSRP